MYPRISNLLDHKANFVLHSWSDNCGRGVWVCCLPLNSQCQTIQEWSHSGELGDDSDYLLDSDWLPVRLERSFADALLALEEQLSKLPIEQLDWQSPWGKAVNAAMEVFRESYLSVDRKYPKLPTDFNIVAQAHHNQLVNGGDIVW